MSILLLVPLVASAATADDGWRSSIWEHAGEPSFGDPALERGDFDPDAMWSFPNDGAAEHPPLADRIYFDVIVDHFVHPHTPAPKPYGTSVRNYGLWYAHAFLGHWRDCNQDGFIGEFATGAVHYPVTPLVSSAVCPVGSPYNDGVMVAEFLAIGPGTRDLSRGSDAQRLCPASNDGPSGQPGATPRAEDGQGVLEGGDNVACFGGTSAYVQDDLAKVWMDFGLAHEPPAAVGAGVFPFPDGTLRDTNGHFRYLDHLTHGQFSRATPLWPAPDGSGDPAPGTQCEPTGDAADVQAVVANAEAGLERGTCSPVPNVSHATVPLGGEVAWPGHLVEDRVNNSESAADRGTPMFEAFDEEGPDGQAGTEDDCRLREDPTRWDDEDDPDPLRAFDVSDPDASAYVGRGDDGPSLEPTVAPTLGGILFNVERATIGDPSTRCDGSGLRNNHPLEESKALQTPLRTRADATFTFLFDAHFNPSVAPGEPLLSTNVCTPRFSVVFGLANRCGGVWIASEQWHSAHGASEARPDVTSSWLVTGYADVSYGPDDFDTAGNGRFTTADALFEVPSGGGFDAAPASTLPARRDDAHAYGDEGCGAITALVGAGPDDFATLSITPVTTGWSCDRGQWADAANLDCTNAVVELACYLLPKVGDAYDLRDIDCYDNDVWGASGDQGTTDESGPLPASGVLGQAQPGRDCDALGGTPPDL